MENVSTLPGSEAANHCGDYRGIQPATEIGADRNVGEEAKAGRVRKQFPKVSSDSGRQRTGGIESRVLVAIGESTVANSVRRGCRSCR